MEYYLFLIRSSFGDLKRNKVRTILTSLGILIGVLSVVLLIAFGEGLRNYIRNQFESLGTNLLYVLPGKVIGEGGGFSDPGALGARFDEKDITKLEKIKGVNFVVPVFEKSITAESGNTAKAASMYATTPEIAKALNLEPEIGSFFTKADLDKRAKTAVIGPKLAEDLFGSIDSALGKRIRISGQSYTVKGILKAKGGGALGGPSFDSFIYIPYKSALSLNPDKKFYTLYVKVTDEKDIQTVKEDINVLLGKRYENDEYQVVEQTEILNIVTSIFSILNSILIAIGSISLLVGGIGIMNIMYATVTERIKEIGIRRAIGATKKDILVQFLTQALILSLIGGLMGLILAFIIVAIIQSFFPAEINVLSVIAALGVSSFIGIFFGVFPARQAANLSPIDAIRYE